MSAIIAAELLRTLSDSLILPFNFKIYANELIREYDDFEKEFKTVLNDELNITLDYLRSSVYNLSSVADNFHRRLSGVDKSKYHLIRMFNEQMRSFEAAFLDPAGIERQGFQ